MNPQPTLVFVPGLGCDARLFEPQRALPWPLVVVDWIEPRRRETLARYAQRLAETVEVDRPFVLGGVSLGGMLALEMSRSLPAEAVFLVASCRTGRAVHPGHRVLGRIVGVLPLPVCRALCVGLARLLIPWENDLNDEQKRVVLQMALDSPMRFVRWASRAVGRWPGVDLPRIPVYQIHGDRDRVIPLSNVRPDHIVHGGTHAINVTHADEVNAYIIEKMKERFPVQ